MGAAPDTGLEPLSHAGLEQKFLVKCGTRSKVVDYDASFLQERLAERG